MVAITTAQDGILRYIENELLPQLTGLKRAGATVYVALASKNMERLMQEYKDHQAVQVLGVIDGDEIDVDKLYDALEPVMKDRMRVDIPIVGEFVFDHDDLVKLTEYMKGAR
nr:MAG TPA: hypothetical protein [Caudoviricetes sp.]